MSTRTATLSAVAAAFGLLLAGCGDSDDSAPDDPPESSATGEAGSEPSPSGSPAGSGEYVPASAEGPAQNVPEPEKPALADEESYEGAQAFLDYLADARAYAWQTGDTSLIREITEEDTCATCIEEYDKIDELYNRGGWATSGQEEIEILDRDMPVNSAGSYSPRVRVGFEGIEIWSEDGELIQKEPADARADDPVYNHLDFIDGEWIHLMTTSVPL